MMFLMNLIINYAPMKAKRALYSNRLGILESSKALRLCDTLLQITPSPAASL